MIKIAKPRKFISPFQKIRYKARLNEFIINLQAKRTVYYQTIYSKSKHEPSKLIVHSGRRYDKIIEERYTTRRNKFPHIVWKGQWYMFFFTVIAYLCSIRKHILQPCSVDTNRGVYCFIEKETGNILKAASWHRPAKHPRGNIYNDNMLNGLTYFGPKYLRG